MKWCCFSLLFAHYLNTKLGQAGAGDNEVKLMMKHAPEWVWTINPIDQKSSTLPLDHCCIRCPNIIDIDQMRMQLWLPFPHTQMLQISWIIYMQTWVSDLYFCNFINTTTSTPHRAPSEWIYIPVPVICTSYWYAVQCYWTGKWLKRMSQKRVVHTCQPSTSWH